ncbi:MAG: hypothetical protein ACM3IL_04580 [Deltaproteobacteria bacterium]
MVSKESPVYLFVGRDSPSKDEAIGRIKKSFLSRKLQDFNFDKLYAKELRLDDLQEKLLCLPVESEKRIIVIKNAQYLKPEIKKFITGYVRQPHKKIILILDIDKPDVRDEFINSIARYVHVYRKDEARLDTFTLCRQIDLKRAGYALKILRQLLEKGERPERILGGLRHTWETGSYHPIETRRRLRLLLNCDIDIKTGRLKPDFVLEKLVVGLCCLTKP